MRRFLLVLVACLLPLQSFAVNWIGLQTSNVAIVAAAATPMEQGAMPCHEAPDHDACCKGLGGSCEMMCHLSMGLLPESVAAWLPSASQEPPAGMLVAFISAHPAQAAKPPIL